MTEGSGESGGVESLVQGLRKQLSITEGQSGARLRPPSDRGRSKSVDGDVGPLHLPTSPFRSPRHRSPPMSFSDGAPHIDKNEFQGRRRAKARSIPYSTDGDSDVYYVRRKHSSERIRRSSIPENDIIYQFEPVQPLVPSAEEVREEQTDTFTSDTSHVSPTAGVTPKTTSSSANTSGRGSEDGCGSDSQQSGGAASTSESEDAAVGEQPSSSRSSRDGGRKRILRRKNTPANFPNVPKTLLKSQLPHNMCEEVEEEEGDDEEEDEGDN